MSDIKTATSTLLNYIEKNDYRGYDPYDALKSPLFRLPFFRSNKLIRFTAQQLVKRSPLDLRPLLAIPKGYNPVTLGLCLQGYVYLTQVDPSRRSEYLHKIDFLIDELIKLQPEGYSGACWGYDFDWEARHARIPAYQPTVVATGIITNALFECFKILNKSKAFELCQNATSFILNDLNRTYEGDSFCFSYSPFDKQAVFNASMKGVRCLAQVYSQTKDSRLAEKAEKASRFVIRHQNDDGSWYYSTAGSGDWIDNYHTGYVLECLDAYILNTGDDRFSRNLNKGMEFYRTHFFESDKIPRFYHDATYPIDCTAAAQSVLTLCRFGELELALNVARWIIENMQDEKGYFYYRKYPGYVRKTSFMRWSQAWMFAALSYLLKPPATE